MRDVRIETERLVIRELRDDDWRALHAVESLPEINRYQAYDAHTEQAARDLIARAQSESLKPTWQPPKSGCNDQA